MAFDYRNRGLRTPMHTGVVTCNPRRLQPFMAAPLRPNETLVGLRMNIGAWFGLGVQLGRHLPIGLEIGVWKVPVTALGQEFQDLVLGGAEEMQAVGQSYPVDLPGPIAEQGHLDGTALGTKHRPWAGEIGQTAVPADSGDARYARWVSEATWAVANSYYDLELDETSHGAREDAALHDEAPFLSDMIRGATLSGVTASENMDEIPTTQDYATSITEWAERLSIMSTVDLTYPEYLQQFGVNPSRLRTLPEPYLYRRGMLSPIGSPGYWHFGANWTSTIDATSHQDFNVNSVEVQNEFGHYVRNMDQSVSGSPDEGVSFAGDRMGIVRLGTNWRMKRQRRMIVDEPSVLLGAYAWWPVMAQAEQYAHHLDMSQMISPAHWGLPTGGVDEADFLSANTLMTPDGTGTQGGENDDITGGLRAFNLLNLFVHGDSFCNDVDRFGMFGPFDQIAERDANAVLTSAHNLVDLHAMVKLAIATDMVG